MNRRRAVPAQDSLPNELSIRATGNPDDRGDEGLERIANQCTHTEMTVRISAASGSERDWSVKAARYRSRY
jgi:hypothetical protein